MSKNRTSLYVKYSRLKTGSLSVGGSTGKIILLDATHEKFFHLWDYAQGGGGARPQDELGVGLAGRVVSF